MYKIENDEKAQLLSRAFFLAVSLFNMKNMPVTELYAEYIAYFIPSDS